MAKLRVGLLFGGRSVEHEVSIASATSILQALDPDRYDVSLVVVDHAGHWHLTGPGLPTDSEPDGPEVTLPVAPGSPALTPWAAAANGGASPSPVPLDVIFPIIHGRGGEDGSLQGLLELVEIPYVGSGVLASAVQMDKDVAKQLLVSAGLPVVPWKTLQRNAEDREASVRAAIDELGLPVFVKPANSGSSVGISKAGDLAETMAAVRDAARYDTKILIEQAVDAREIEVAVIGNDRPEASVPGEIVPAADFYDYESKYVDEGTELVVPARLDEATSQQIRSMALDAFTALCSSGLARVDFLVDRGTGALYINELNSLPGFTDASMFPRLWEATGLGYPALLDRLIELALERHAERSALETIYRKED